MTTIEIEQWYHKWMADRGKSGIATVNVLDMLKDFDKQIRTGFDESSGVRTFDQILEDYHVQLEDNRRDESIKLAAEQYAQQLYGSSLPSGGKSAEEILMKHEWLPGGGWTKQNMLSAMEEYASQYAHQQPVQGQLCPKCNGEGKCFEILIPTEYRVCPVCNGDKILYPPISQQPVNDGWRVYNTGVDITEQCTFESGVITINSDVAKIKVNPDEPRCY